MTTEKRKRITREETVTLTVEAPTQRTFNYENSNVSLEEFDWDAHMSDCPSRIRKGNPYIKAPKGTKVYYQGADAQKWLDLYEGVMVNFKPTIALGEHYEGTIYSMNNDWAMIDVGYRELVYIDLAKEPANIRPLVAVGEKFNVNIIATADRRGFIVGSIGDGIRQGIINELKASIESGNTAYIGNVTQMIPGGGYIVQVQGIDCFMPGSLAGANKLADFESIIGTEMYVCPVSYSHEKGTVVVSHRKYLQALIPSEVEKLKSLEKNTVISGVVTGSAKYGVFVEFNGCLTGMIHANDLSDANVTRLNAREIEAGETIEFMVKEVISEKKIMLTQKEEVETINPWDGLSAKYNVPASVRGTVKALKDYGIFVTIEEGIVGLLHISELEGIDISTIKKGDPISVIITRIDEPSRKVFLKLV
jgi:small subunit ribosomal protein S1